MRPIVTITTDFGVQDEYVAAMKGRILGRCPDCQLVDVTHSLPHGNILRAALVVRDVAPYFPAGTVHLVVVDPGVGTARRPLVVDGPGWTAVGPDNGVLSLLWTGKARPRFFEIEPAIIARWSVSTTFHGRDLFAPAAALVAAGAGPDELGPTVGDPLELELPVPSWAGSALVGEVLYADRFGNLVTNLQRDQLPGPPERLIVKIGDHTIQGLVRTYAHGGADPLALIGSTGHLEIALFGGSAAERLSAGCATPVQVVAAHGEAR